MNEGTPNQFVTKVEDAWANTPSELFTTKNVRVKRTLFVSDREVHQQGGQKFNRTAFSTVLSGSVYSSAVTDYLIAITNFSYAPSVGLPDPASVGVGKTFIIKDEVGEAGTTTITIRSARERQIEAMGSTTISTAFGSKAFYTNGSDWFTY